MTTHHLPSDIDRSVTAYSRRSVASELRALATAKALYRAMILTAFGTPEEMSELREHVRRAQARVRELASAEDAVECDGIVAEMMDGMVNRAMFGRDLLSA